MTPGSSRGRISWPGRVPSAVLLLAILAGCASETTGLADGDGVLGEYMMFEGQRRDYVLQLPGSYDPGQPAPLLILFHGAGDTGAGFQGRIGLDSVADAAGFITVYPDGRPIRPCLDTEPDECRVFRSWEQADVVFTQLLIEHLDDHLAIDSERIFAAGLSMGAVITYDLACRLSDQFAGVVTVAATLTGAIVATCDPSQPISIAIIHGTADDVFPWDGIGSFPSIPETIAIWASFNGCVGDPTIEWLPDIADDSTRVWTETRDDCAGGAEVTLYGVEGGGHTWPGGPGPLSPKVGYLSRDISASAEIVAFFSRHSLNQ